MKIRRHYVEGRYGQVHYHETAPSDGTYGPRPLYCLHATAYSGRTFEPLMQILGPRRRVVAIDTPGYGGSDPPPSRIDVGGYAEALAEAIAAIEGNDAPVDFFGYHTGALFAVALAARHPSRVHRMCLLGIPYFTGKDAATWERKLVRETHLGESFDQFRDRWDYLVAGRPAGMPLTRAFDNFVDELRSYPRDWWAHKALFEHDAGPSLRHVACPVRVINIDGPLTPASSAAAALMPQSEIHALHQVSAGALDLGAAPVAAAIDEFLA